MSGGTTASIAPHILVISVFLSITWGIYVVYTILDYARAREKGRGATLRSFRRFLVALCLWLVCFSYVFRTTLVVLGFGDESVGVILFFALIGTNVLGSLYAVISLRYDDD